MGHKKELKRGIAQFVLFNCKLSRNKHNENLILLS